MTLIFLLFGAWYYLTAPSAAQVAAARRTTDSVAMAKRNLDSLAKLPDTLARKTAVQIPDSVRNMQLVGTFGVFAAAAQGEEKMMTLENEDFVVTFSNKGGSIKQVRLKKFTKIKEDSTGKIETKEPLLLLEDKKNQFEYLLPVTSGSGLISTADLFFTAQMTGNTAIFRATAANGAFLEQKYVINGKGYGIDYDLRYEGFGNVLKTDAKTITLNWVNYLDKIERNAQYERNYTSLYYKQEEKSASYCSCTANDTKDIKEKSIKWVSGANQFFNSALIAKTGFKSATVSTEMSDPADADLKKLTARLSIPVETSNGTFAMQMYVGPNSFDILRSYKVGLEDVISYGNSLFGTINRWIIRPIFEFLHSFIGSVGICILLLTFLVKFTLYPLSLGMIRSQAKTAALKPEVDKLRERIKDPQQVQVETMKLYQEFGVNPLGGCLPTLLQMPIWMALFRFFPATIDFRQQSFLWAHDLTAPEVFAHLPFAIPFYGSHVSLFALLWSVSLLFFTWYNNKTMNIDYSSQPAMKYVQYITPVMFMFFFNSYAAGLSLYMLFSNVLNILQTIVTKNFVINHEKIRETLMKNKSKPKKKSGFRATLEKAVAQQQALKEEQEKAKGKKK